MPTSFDVVIDLALVSVDDYKLNKLYDQNRAKFQRYCDGILVSAIPNFTRCRVSLAYDLQARQFVSDLSNTEISILADFWQLEWFKKETNDTRKFNALLQSSGSFKTHSAAQNLKEKGTYLNALREKVQQKITEYELQYVDDIDME